MPDYRRWYVPGATVYFTLVTAGRAEFLTTDPARALLRRVIRDCRTRYPFRILAAVLLPDHLHMIWSLPPGEVDFSTRWSFIKGNFTREWLASGHGEQIITDSKLRHRHRGVWQRRFWDHVIRDDDDMVRHMEYIHYNPVKHGYVQCPADWPYSSFHRYVKMGFYPPDWCCPNLVQAPDAPDFSAIKDSIGE